MIKKEKLNNGITIVHEYLSDVHSATIMIWVKAGPHLENKSQVGICHFIEHMLFKGTKTRNAKDIAFAIEYKGGSLNAFTEKEATCFYAKVLTEESANALEILLDMILYSNFDDNDIEVERKVILEEIKMYEDCPEELVQDLLLNNYWKNHPLGAFITGDSQTVSKLSKQDMLNFMNSHYTPDNIVISICGNYNEEQIIGKIKEYTQNWKSKSLKESTKQIEIHPGIKIYKKDIEQTHIGLATKAIPLVDERRYALAIIDICLGDGMSSVLFQEIREKRGLAYSIETFESLHQDTGLFGIFSACDHNNAKQVIDLIINILDEFKSRGISQEELINAKMQLRGNILIGLESTKYRASKNGRAQLYLEKNFTIDELCQSIDKITVQDINQLCSYMFDKKYYGITILAPEDANTKILEDIL